MVGQVGRPGDSWNFVEDVWIFVEDVWIFVENVWIFVEDSRIFVENIWIFVEDIWISGELVMSLRCYCYIYIMCHSKWILCLFQGLCLFAIIRVYFRVVIQGHLFMNRLFARGY